MRFEQRPRLGLQAMNWGGVLVQSKAQKTKFRRSQIGRHPYLSPACQRSWNSNRGLKVNRSQVTGQQREPTATNGRFLDLQMQLPDLNFSSSASSVGGRIAGWRMAVARTCHRARSKALQRSQQAKARTGSSSGFLLWRRLKIASFCAGHPYDVNVKLLRFPGRSGGCVAPSICWIPLPTVTPGLSL